MKGRNTAINILVLIFLCSTINTQAQQKPTKIKYTNINNFQMLGGKQSFGLGIETIHGIKFKNNCSIGIGAAMDMYKMVSVPVFLDVRKSFGNKMFIPFMYANAGLNFNLHDEQYPKYQNGLEAYQFKNSFYSALGIGIKRKISSSANFLFSFGLSTKQFKYNYNNTWFIWQDAFNPYYQYNYTFKRYSCKIGIEF